MNGTLYVILKQALMLHYDLILDEPEVCKHGLVDEEPVRNAGTPAVLSIQ